MTLQFTMIFRGMNVDAAANAWRQTLELERQLHIDIPDPQERKAQWFAITNTILEYVEKDGEENFPAVPGTMSIDEWRAVGGPDYVEAMRWRQLMFCMLASS